MHAPSGRYFVRVGGDVRGPVDDATIAQWLAQGMRGAEVCQEGTTQFLPIERTPLARLVPGAGRGRRVAQAGGAATVGALVLVTVFGRGMRFCNRQLDEDKKAMVAALPKVGATGALHRGDGSLKLCPQSKHGWGWPCGTGRAVTDGARVEVMKAGVFQMESVCRYWVKGGPDDGATGDAPCAWFAPKPNEEKN